MTQKNVFRRFFFWTYENQQGGSWTGMNMNMTNSVQTCLSNSSQKYGVNTIPILWEEKLRIRRGWWRHIKPTKEEKGKLGFNKYSMINLWEGGSYVKKKERKRRRKKQERKREGEEPLARGEQHLWWPPRTAAWSLECPRHNPAENHRRWQNVKKVLAGAMKSHQTAIFPASVKLTKPSLTMPQPSLIFDTAANKPKLRDTTGRALSRGETQKTPARATK